MNEPQGDFWMYDQQRGWVKVGDKEEVVRQCRERRINPSTILGQRTADGTFNNVNVAACCMPWKCSASEGGQSEKIDFDELPRKKKEGVQYSWGSISYTASDVDAIVASVKGARKQVQNLMAQSGKMQGTVENSRTPPRPRGIWRNLAALGSTLLRVFSRRGATGAASGRKAVLARRIVGGPAGRKRIHCRDTSLSSSEPGPELCVHSQFCDTRSHAFLHGRDPLFSMVVVSCWIPRTSGRSLKQHQAACAPGRRSSLNQFDPHGRRPRRKP